MKKTHFFLVFSFILSLAATSSWAASAYVSDFFEVTVRTGPSIKNKVLSTLSSGQAVKVLEAEGEWTRVNVKTQAGEDLEGWMLSRYITTRLPWELQANTAKEQNSTLKEKLTKAEQERNELREREKELSGRLQGTATALDKLQGQYESLKKGAAEYVTLKKEFDAAKTALESNQRTLETISGENLELKSSSREKWVLTGAGILLFGLIFGLIMGRMQRKKRRSPVYS